MKSKHLLLSASFFVVSTWAQGETVGQDGILRDDQGEVIYMNQADSIKACARNGMRLPTVREFAIESQGKGAKGILELSQVEPDPVPNGYYKVSAINPNGQKDEFYFSFEGYKDNGELGFCGFWSSSIYSIYHADGYAFYCLRGGVDRDNRGIYYAARCVVGQ